MAANFAPHPISESGPSGSTTVPNGISAWLERRQSVAIAVLLVIFVPLTLVTAALKPLSHDELFTYFIAQLSAGTIWTAISSGADTLPPLNDYVTHFSMAVLGDSALAFRIPGVLALWGGLFCLYAFVARRLPVPCALAAVLLTLSSKVYETPLERGYALVFFLAALALLAWQRTDGHPRVLALVVLGLSLAAGVYTHYYAVLSAIPIVCGEAARTIRKRTIDWPVWAAIASPALLCLPVITLIRGAHGFSTGFWSPVGIPQAAGLYSQILGDGVLPLLAIVVMIGFAGLGTHATAGAADKAHDAEVAAAAGCLLMPVGCYLLAKYVTGALWYTYVLPGVLGYAVLVGYASFQISRFRARFPLAVLTVMLVAGLANSAFEIKRQARLRADLDSSELVSRLPDAGAPVVITDPEEFLQRSYYAGRSSKGLLYYLTDVQAAAEIKGSDTADRAFLLLKPWRHVNTADYKQFVAAHDRFWILSSPKGWLLEKVIADRADVRAVRLHGSEVLYEVKPTRVF